MDKAPKKLVPWRNLVYLVLLLFGWARYRLFTNYQQVGGWEESSIASIAITVCVFLLVSGGMFWYANLPEREGQP
jgi:hypothetical protein